MSTIALPVQQLSPMQSVILDYAVSRADSGFYIVQITGNLPADVDLLTLERAWAHVIRRHPILRASFAVDPDGARQQVDADVTCPLQVYDWRQMDACEQTAALQRFAAADRTAGFAIGTPPLMRLAVIRLTDDDRVFLWTYHHLLLDSRARFIVLRDVDLAYKAYARGQALDHTTPPAFADYIAWLGTQDADAARRFWVAQLGSPVELRPLALPCRRGGDADAGVGSLTIRVTPDFRAALLALAQRHRVTVNILVQAAWAILQSQYSGSSDVLFGVTRSGRRIAFDRAPAVVGLFMNSMPHRIRVSLDTALARLLGDLRRQHTDIRPFQHVSTSQIRQWCAVPPDRLLFDSIVNLQEEGISYALHRAGCDFWREGLVKCCHTPYPLKIAGVMKPDLVLEISYDRGRFEDRVMEDAACRLTALLQAMVERADARIAEVVAASKPRRVCAPAFRSIETAPAPSGDIGTYRLRVNDEFRIQNRWSMRRSASAAPSGRAI